MGRAKHSGSAPAALNEYTLMSDRAGEFPELERLTERTAERRTLHEDAGRTRVMLSEERTWNFQNTIAFWAATFFIQGSVLFTIGSACMYPSVLTVCGEEGTDAEDETVNCQPEFIYKAWVDYSFMIGAWCFTAGNYCVYFQVINSHDEDDGDDKYDGKVRVQQWARLLLHDSNSQYHRYSNSSPINNGLSPATQF